MTTDRARLADRIRATLTAQRSRASREVEMFGALSFMVNDKVVVSVRGDGELGHARG